MIQLTIEAYLESFPLAAALIGSNGQVVGANDRLNEMKPSPVGKLCHEAIAGLPEPCPFCPLDEMLPGKSDPLIGVTHVRRGRKCRVNVSFVSIVEPHGMVLETIDYPAEKGLQGVARAASEGVTDEPPGDYGILFSIAVDLMDLTPMDERMLSVVNRIKDILHRPAATRIWVEIDDHLFGDSPGDRAMTSGVDIKVDGKSRGRLCADLGGTRDLNPGEERVLEKVAHLIGLKMETSEAIERLRRAERRHRRMAGNLAKEMWSRTEALASERGYLEGILTSSQDIIITTDLDARIVEFNPGAERLLGYPAEEMQGRDADELWECADERKEIMEQVWASGSISNYETRLKTKSGELLEISLTLSKLVDGEGTVLGTVGVSKDVSREQAIRRELETLNQNYRETINFISHESKNSLMVIVGFLRRLLKEETDTGRKHKLGIVFHHSKFLEAMTRDFLVMSNLERGEFQLRKELIEDLHEEAILPAMTGLRERYPDSFESYDSRMADANGIRLQGNKELLQIVYRNLFGNALKYGNPGSKILYGVEERPDRYLLNVWNAGPGIPKDKVERIFDKFYRIHDENTHGKPGTGLGLSNIRRIIEAHGGRIWCETNPGEWINFLFELPKE